MISPVLKMVWNGCTVHLLSLTTAYSTNIASHVSGAQGWEVAWIRLEKWCLGMGHFLHHTQRWHSHLCWMLAQSLRWLKTRPDSSGSSRPPNESSAGIDAPNPPAHSTIEILELWRLRPGMTQHWQPKQVEDLSMFDFCLYNDFYWYFISYKGLHIL